MFKAQKRQIKRWCERMAAGKEAYIKASEECGEIVHIEHRELFFTAAFFPVLVEAYKPKVIHFNPEWGGEAHYSTGEEWFEVELCGEKYKIFALWNIGEE